MKRMYRIFDYITALFLMFYISQIYVCNQWDRMMFERVKDEMHQYGALICRQGYISEDVERYISEGFGKMSYSGSIYVDGTEISQHTDGWKEYLGTKVYPLNTFQRIEIVVKDIDDVPEKLLFLPISVPTSQRRWSYCGRVRDGIFERGGLIP